MKKVLFGFLAILIMLVVLTMVAKKLYPTFFYGEVDIEKVISLESSYNPLAYNKRSKARGLMQITPICLKEWNERRDLKKQYSLIDLWNPIVNRKIGTWYINVKIPKYLMYYKIEDTIENRLMTYNWGIGNVRKYISGKITTIPTETINYIAKYMGEK